MKKLFIIIAILAFTLPAANLQSQVLSESAKKKFTVGVDFFTDIWMYEIEEPYLPSQYSNRTINQGATAFMMYNLQLGESLSAFSIGLAIRNHNSYSNSVIPNIKSDTIKFELIDVDYRKSKLNLVYLDLPIEFKYRTEGGFKLGIGLKVGYLIDSKQKYKGDRPPDEHQVLVKSKKVNQLEKWSYGATLRIGYKWVSLFGYYQFNKIFVKGRGPDMYPISVGLTITPF